MPKARTGQKMIPADERLVYSVPEAGRLLGLGRQASYAAVRRGDIPTIPFGRLKRVPKAAIHRMIGIDPPLAAA